MLFNRDEWVLKRRQERAKKFLNLDTEIQKAKEKIDVHGQQCSSSGLTTPSYSSEGSPPLSLSPSPYAASKRDLTEKGNIDGPCNHLCPSNPLIPKTEKAASSLPKVNELRSCQIDMQK